MSGFKNLKHIIHFKVMKRGCLLLTFCLTILCIAIFNDICAATGIYSYQDDKGTWHFTNVPTDPRYSSRTTEYADYPVKKTKRTNHPYNSSFSRQISHKKLVPIINNNAEKYNLDPELIKAVIKVESNGRIDVRSSKGAMGLMQLMPDTARALGIRNPFDPAENITGGSRYLRTMLETFNGDMLMALAAYNAGPAAVQKYKGIPPYPETIQYVEKVLMEWYRNLKKKR